jgi:DNA repair protein RecN (Recombination protein N)
LRGDYSSSITLKVISRLGKRFMLKFFNITNFAVIQRLAVEFHEGLNLLTGETGSGKSIIVDALGLLLGGRSSAAQIRTGERMALVEGVFALNEIAEQKVRQLLAEVGIETQAEGELFIRRELYANGRSRIFIDEQSATAATLRVLQPFLVEIHGQGEQRALLSAQSHLELLDSFGGCLSMRQEVGTDYARWKAAGKALHQLEQELAERDLAEDLLQYQLREIETINPQVGEDEELAAERKLLTHAEKVLQLGAGAYAELYDSDESILSRLATVRRRVEDLSEIDARVCPLLEMLETCATSLTEVAGGLRGYSEGIEFSPARLGEIEQRLLELERIKRKYSSDLSGILKVRDELLGRLDKLSNLAEREQSLRESLKQAESIYVESAGRLSASRAAAAPKLARRVMEDLTQVAMERARFLVSMETAQWEAAETLPQEDAIQPHRQASDNALRDGFFTLYGADHVEFLLSANPGESPRKLAQTASGGELSRLMLTLRTVGTAKTKAEIQSVATVVFDEIDAGIGGKVAEAVGKRLKALAATRQVLCVTHQAQIARFADHHYVVTKAVQNERTITTIRDLSSEERVGELARMIGGAEEAATTREAARWLLEHAQISVGPKARAKKKRKN